MDHLLSWMIFFPLIGAAAVLLLPKDRHDLIRWVATMATLPGLFLAWFDRTIIDGIVNGAATLVRTIGELDGAFDKYVVDGAVNALADGTYAFGRTLKQIQSGAINAYLIVIVTGVLGGVLMYFVIGAFAATP